MPTTETLRRQIQDLESDLSRQALAERRAELDELDRQIWQQKHAAWLAEQRKIEQRTAELAELDDFLEREREREYRSPEAVAARKVAHDRETKALDQQLWHKIDRAETERIRDWTFRRSWDREHPPGTCQCRGHRLWRREPVD
jgi:hypothetical protein